MGFRIQHRQHKGVVVIFTDLTIWWSLQQTVIQLPVNLAKPNQSPSFSLQMYHMKSKESSSKEKLDSEGTYCWGRNGVVVQRGCWGPDLARQMKFCLFPPKHSILEDLCKNYPFGNKKIHGKNKLRTSNTGSYVGGNYNYSEDWEYLNSAGLISQLSLLLSQKEIIMWHDT